jgi:hypothetical protein
VPFPRASAAVAGLLSSWVQAHGLDGVYLDEYFAPALFEKIYTPKLANLTLDSDGDGRVDSTEDIMAQYAKHRNDLAAALRASLGPTAILIANTAGAGADPNLNGITLEMESCAPDMGACEGWLRDQERIGAKPPVSVIWTIGGIPALPAEVQCANAARLASEMPWVQVGSAWARGTRVIFALLRFTVCVSHRLT